MTGSTQPSAAEIAATLVRQFDQMVRRDGGSVSLVDVDGSVVRVGYRPGVDPECDGGVCVMPHAELQDLMGETAARRDPSLRIVVELVTDAASGGAGRGNDEEKP